VTHDQTGLHEFEFIYPLIGRSEFTRLKGWVASAQCGTQSLLEWSPCECFDKSPAVIRPVSLSLPALLAYDSEVKRKMQPIAEPAVSVTSRPSCLR
jgi:hypothetical protein